MIKLNVFLIIHYFNFNNKIINTSHWNNYGHSPAQRKLFLPCNFLFSSVVTGWPKCTLSKPEFIIGCTCPPKRHPVLVAACPSNCPFMLGQVRVSPEHRSQPVWATGDRLALPTVSVEQRRPIYRSLQTQEKNSWKRWVFVCFVSTVWTTEQQNRGAKQRGKTPLCWRMRLEWIYFIVLSILI